MTIQVDDFKHIEKFLDALMSSLGYRRGSSLGDILYEKSREGRNYQVRIPSVVKRGRVNSPSRKQAHVIIFELSTKTQARLTIVQDGEFGEAATARYQQAVDNKQVDGLDPAFSDYKVWAYDPEWARALLGEPELAAIIKAHDGAVNFTPGAARVLPTLPPCELNEELVQKIEADLTLLVEKAEMRPPEMECKQSFAERATKLDKPILIGLGIFLMTMLLPMVGAIYFVFSRMSTLQ